MSLGKFKSFQVLNLKKLSRNKTFKRKGIIIGSALLVLAIFVFIFNFAYRTKILPQTYIGGINLGGKTKIQAEILLKEEINKSAKSAVELKHLDQTWVVAAEDIKVSYQVNNSLNSAWQVGREGSFGKIILQQLKSVFGGNNIALAFNYDKPILNGKIMDIANIVDIDEKDATVKIEDLKVVVLEEREGQSLDTTSAYEEILSSFGNLKKKSVINLPVDKIAPKVLSAAAQIAATQVREILLKEVKLKSEKQDYILKPEEIASYLIFVGVPEQNSDQKINLKQANKNNIKWSLAVVVNSASIKNYISLIAGEINQDPQDAKFQVEDGKVTVFQASKTGYSLDKEKSESLISQAILGNKKSVELPVTVKEPEVSSSSASTMGLTELVGEGVTSWRGSPPNRINNLLLGAKMLSGIIVKPGEEFSTVKSMGPIDLEAGFLPELVIKNSTQVIPEVGGGLCQVSTTLFRAILNSGLEITDRSAHSFRVSYYEPPVGMDATIYDPAPDLKFVNNYATPILIWAFGGSSSLTFQIYGTKDNRKIEISDPIVYNYTDPPAPVYTESDSMEPGTIRQVERPTRGATASFTYKVTDVAGQVLQDETYVSKYVAIPESYLVGAGYQAPAEEPPSEGG